MTRLAGLRPRGACKRKEKRRWAHSIIDSELDGCSFDVHHSVSLLLDSYFSFQRGGPGINTCLFALRWASVHTLACAKRGDGLDGGGNRWEGG